ncbi:MAG TPA: hypothetical protein VF533_02280 [Solirubrobacteraceae bacterium]|jgi:hypothetical protein
MRTVILGIALGFTALLGFLTVFVIATSGIGVLEVISLLVLAMFAFGIIGALTNPPDRR